jgi:hypothetical protein
MIEPCRSAGHRLVHRVALVDANAHLVGIGKQRRVEQARVLGVDIAELALELLVALAVFRIAEHRAQLRGRAHRGAAAQERREARVAEPRLVPQEHEVRLDGEAFEHRALDVRDVAVEGAVGQHEHLRPVQLALGLQLQERLLDRADRETAVHRVLRQGKCIDVQGLRAGEHDAVVMRLVAVAVDQDDVARRQKRLVDDLVRRGGAVGDEEAAIAAERPCRLVLRDLDVAGGLQEAVEASRGRGRFGEEQVRPVELAHVPDPVRLEDGLAARQRQRVESADRPGRVLLEIVEERRVVAILDAVEDREVDLHRFLDAVERAPDRRGLIPTRQLGDVVVGDHEEVELGPQRAHDARETARQVLRHAGGVGRNVRGEDLTQRRHVVLRGIPEAVDDHHGLEL